ncbi:hypothetical protein evm_005642 [Chilo suppressalis]|nr:hypothetical protein evm_005642 [Chilo suppressalis]
MNSGVRATGRDGKGVRVQYIRQVREIEDGNRICRPCFQRALRYSQRRLRQEVPAVAGAEPAVEVEPAVVAEPAVGAEPALDENVEHGLPAQNVLRFPVPGFTRAPFNTRLCIFQNCNGLQLTRINNILRSTILRDKSFYIPFGARVCEEHRFDPAWNDIPAIVRHVYALFSPRQVSDILRLLQTRKIFFNFERLSSMPDDIFQYYIGFSKAHFTQVLESTPTITREHPKAATALATLLVKLHTEEPNQRLCSIFKMARSTFEEKMNSVINALMDEFVPRYMGYNHNY